MNNREIIIEEINKFLNECATKDDVVERAAELISIIQILRDEKLTLSKFEWKDEIEKEINYNEMFLS